MKKLIESVTYESPAVELLNWESEGILCESTYQSGHNPFKDGDDLNF